ncbi:hypothetical protein ABW19_dt0206772 [Dactylella cylindrospora]|nr:hypothetical protein ABW19_dt0206772 [Dactylella cylindrospora]
MSDEDDFIKPWAGAADDGYQNPNGKEQGSVALSSFGGSMDLGIECANTPYDVIDAQDQCFSKRYNIRKTRDPAPVVRKSWLGLFTGSAHSSDLLESQSDRVIEKLDPNSPSPITLEPVGLRSEHNGNPIGPKEHTELRDTPTIVQKPPSSQEVEKEAICACQKSLEAALLFNHSKLQRIISGDLENQPQLLEEALKDTNTAAVCQQYFEQILTSVKTEMEAKSRIQKEFEAAMKSWALEATSLKGSHKRLEEQLAEARREVEVKETENTKLVSRMGEMEDTSNTRNTEYERNLQSLYEEIESLKSQLDSKNDYINRNNEEKSSLQDQLSSAKRERDGARSEARDLNDVLDKAKTFQHHFERKMKEDMKIQEAQFNEVSEALKSEKEVLKMELQGAEARLICQRDLIERTESSRKQLEELTEESKKICTGLQRQASELQNQLNEEQSARKGLKADFEALNSEKCALESSLRQELEIANVAKQNLQAELRSLAAGHRSEVLRIRLESDSRIEEIIRDNTRLEIELKTKEGVTLQRDNHIERLRARLKTARTELDEAVKGQALAQIRLEEANSLAAGRTETATNLSKEIHTLKMQTARKGKEISRLNKYFRLKYSEKIILTQEKEIAEKSQEIYRQEMKLEEQEEQILKAQMVTIGNLERVQHTFLDDSRVEQTLQQDVFSKLRLWARKHTSKSNTVNGHTTDGGLLQSLDHILDPAESQGLFTKYPHIIVEAVLSNQVAEVFLKQPFFFLATGEAPSGITQTLQNLYHSFLKVDVTAGHKWRFETLQLLKQIRSSPTRESYYNKTELSRIQRKICEREVKNFIEGPAGVLLDRNESVGDPTRELVNIFNEIAEISVQLWSQKPFLKVQGFEAFEGTDFHWGSHRFLAHPLNHLSRPNRKHSRDGCPIAIVIQPGIVAYGNEEGKEYDREKVWAKAVVALSI